MEQKKEEEVTIVIPDNITDTVGISEKRRIIEEKEDASKTFFRNFSIKIVTVACIVFNLYLLISGMHSLLMGWMFVLLVMVSMASLIMFAIDKVLMPALDSKLVLYSKFVHIFFISTTIAILIYYLSRLVP